MRMDASRSSTEFTEWTRIQTCRTSRSRDGGLRKCGISAILAAIERLLAKDATTHGLGIGGQDLVGPEGFLPFHQAFLGSFADFNSRLRISWKRTIVLRSVGGRQAPSPAAGLGWRRPDGG